MAGCRLCLKVGSGECMGGRRLCLKVGSGECMAGWRPNGRWLRWHCHVVLHMGMNKYQLHMTTHCSSACNLTLDRSRQMAVCTCMLPSYDPYIIEVL
jgi:hypothetical protein